MLVNPLTAERYCNNCVEVRFNGNITHEEPEAPKKAIHSSYDQSKHFKSCIDYILSRRKQAFSPQDMEKIDYIIRRDNVTIRNVADMRRILKECGLTKHNKFAPLLMTMKTRMNPPKLSTLTLQRISMRFDRIVHYVSKIKDEGNCPYYPYFIYKQIELEIDYLAESDPAEVAELRRTLCYIHMQSAETIQKNDALYKRICEMSCKADGLVFKATRTN